MDICFCAYSRRFQSHQAIYIHTPGMCISIADRDCATRKKPALSKRTYIIDPYIFANSHVSCLNAEASKHKDKDCIPQFLTATQRHEGVDEKMEFRQMKIKSQNQNGY